MVYTPLCYCLVFAPLVGISGSGSVRFSYASASLFSLRRLMRNSRIGKMVSEFVFSLPGSRSGP